MRAGAMAWAAVFVGIPGAAFGSLVEVYRGPSTVDAAPYVDAVGIEERVSARALEKALRSPPDRFGVLPGRFPVRPGPLRRAAPGTVGGAPGGQAFFVVGASDGAWLRRKASELRKLGAAGYVVDAATEADYEALARVVREERLVAVPVPGAAVREALGVATYPVLVRVGETD